MAQTDDRIELPAPAKRGRRWPWVVGYVLALALLAFFGVTVDQTGNNENVWWTAFALVALGRFRMAPDEEARLTEELEPRLGQSERHQPPKDGDPLA